MCVYVHDEFIALSKTEDLKNWEGRLREFRSPIQFETHIKYVSFKTQYIYLWRNYYLQKCHNAYLTLFARFENNRIVLR